MRDDGNRTAGGDRQAGVGAGFVTLYAVAQIGAFIAFLPLLEILLPHRAVAIDQLHGTALLSRVSLVGALVASLANILAGALSDRTHSARGRRRPWLLGGLAATLGSYCLIWAADTPGRLLAAVIVFQIAFNAMFAPLGAVLADDVPEGQRGFLSSLLGLGYPIGGMVGIGAVGAWRMGDAKRYQIVAALVLLCVLPFAWSLRGRGDAPPGHTPIADHPQSTAHRPATGFMLVWISRLLVMTAIGILQGYLLMFLGGRDTSFLPPSLRPEAAIAQMTTIATVCNVACGLLCGVVSDRVGRRSVFAAGGAMLLAAGMGCLALLHGWAALRAAAMLYGAGIGIFTTIDLALMIQVLPTTQRAGQFLGIMNLCNTVAQIAAPLIALLVLGGSAPRFRALFLLAGFTSVLGAACLGASRTMSQCLTGRQAK
jgi:MFS family permease